MTKLIINCETGETVERELNKAEKDQQKIDEAEIATQKEQADSEAKTKSAAKADLLAKLGITAEEAKLLLS